MNLPEVKEELGAPKEMTFQSCNMDINRGFLMVRPASAIEDAQG